MKKIMMKRFLAFAMALVMCVGLLPITAFAEEQASEEVLNEESAAETVLEPAGEMPSEKDTELTAMPTPSAIRVSFSCIPAETLIWVYDAADEDTVMEPEEDGSFLLVPGEYTYAASCEGYTGLCGALTVDETSEDIAVDVVLDKNEETETIATYSASSTGWLWPVKSSKTIGSNFGMRDLDGDGTKESFHSGIDILVAHGSEVRAAKSGQIIDHVNKYAWDEKVWTSDMSSYGNYVAIKHDDGTYAIYAHLSPNGMTTSGYVNQGDTIALSGNSGNSGGDHLHFQVSKSTNGWSLAANVINTMPTEETISRLGLTVINGYQAASGYDSTRMEYIYELNTVPDAPTLIGLQDNYPASPGSQVTITFQWTDVGADDYNLEFATLQDNGTYKNWEDILGYSGTQSAGLLFTTGWYYVDIYAINSTGPSSSTRYYFSVGNTPPDYTNAVPVKSLEYNGHLYERFDYHMSWTEAKTYCEKLGGHLVTITSAEEQNAVVSMLTGSRNGMYYIGGTDSTLGGNWSWITGEAFSYSNWDTTEPSRGAREYYAEIMARSYGDTKELGDWNDTENTGKNFYAPGNTGFICEYDSIDPCHNGHSWDNGKITKKATCTETGTKTYTCTVCGESYIETVAVLGHDYVETIIHGTCTQRPGIKYDCSRCGNSYTAWDEGSWSEWSTEYPSDYDEDDIQAKIQYRYSAKETTTSSSPALDGWTQSGSEQVWSNYGAWSNWSRTYVAASDSTQVETAPLYRYYYFLCNGCGDHNPLGSACGCGSKSNTWNQTDSTIPYTQCNSSVVSYATQKRQTTSLGDGQLWYFSSGNLNNTAIGTVDSDSSSIVINQGYRYRTRTQSTVYHFYRWGEWSNWSDTELAESETLKVEMREVYRYNLYAKGEHSWNDGKVTIQSTCTAEGEKTFTCKVCGEIRTEVITAAGHTVVTDPAVAATCTKSGKTAGSHCSVCNAVIKAQTTVPATGHNFSVWKETKAPSLTEDGKETRTCQNSGCDVSETRAVKAVIYTISYDANGGTGAPTAQQKLKGAAITLSATKPTYSGHTFKGWALSKAATTVDYAPSANYTDDADATLYAVWEENIVVDENTQAIVVSSINVRPGEEVDVTVSLKNNPGIIGMTLKFEYNQTAMKLLSMTESGLEGIWQKSSGITWASSTGNSTYNGVFLTLRFAVNADTEEGDYQVKVLYGEGDICNDDLENVSFVSVPGIVTVKNRIPGDVNGDGKINTKDFVTLMKLLAGEDVYYVPGSTDINGDGNVNTKDFITLMKYLSGQDVSIY